MSAMKIVLQLKCTVLVIDPGMEDLSGEFMNFPVHRNIGGNGRGPVHH